MKAKWLVLLALAFLLVAVGAERFTALRVRREVAQKDRLKQELGAAEERQRGRQSESRRYAEIGQLAAAITAPQKNWQTDPTQLLRWFAETGMRDNVRVLSSKIVSVEHDGNLVAGGTYNRIRFDLDLEGEYTPLVRYIDAVERSGQPMIVETFSLFADRSAGSAGKMKLFVSCLTPVAETKPAR